MLGTFLLWVAWYGFNCGSTLRLNDDTAAIAARIAVVTTLSAAAGGLGSLFIAHSLAKRAEGRGTYDVADLCNGIIAGLVAVTAGCAVVEPWASLIIGLGGSVIYHVGSWILIYFRIDDAVSATPVHFGAGLWGLIAPGLFARPAHVRQVYKRNKGGLFYDGDGRILAVNLIAALATTAWVVCTMGPFFYLLYKTNSLRVSMDKEIDGLDEDKHGGAAYAFDRSQHSKEAGDNQSVPETKEEDVSSLRTGSPIQRAASREINHMDTLPDDSPRYEFDAEAPRPGE